MSVNVKLEIEGWIFERTSQNAWSITFNGKTFHMNHSQFLVLAATLTKLRDMF